MTVALLLRYWRWIAIAILIASLAIGIPLAKHHYDATQQKTGYDKRAAEDKAASDAQAARNLDLQRAAEKSYVVRRDAQEKVFITVTKEVHDLAAPLRACPLDPGLVRVLNDANHCASGDPAATGCSDGEVPAP